jgi:HD-like signal output (HDOD) protein
MKMENDPCGTEFAGSIKNLPSLNPVAVRFSEIAGGRDAEIDDMVSVLRLDPVLTGRILRLANSAYIGIPNSITSLRNAVVLLGRKRIYSLVVAGGILSGLNMSKSMPFSIKDYWKHSFITAAISESISKYMRRYEPIDTDDVFTAGLLHDIGKLVAGISVTGQFEKAVEKSRSNAIPFFIAEKPETSHTAAGKFLAMNWNFPSLLQETMLRHHLPSSCKEFVLIVSIVHIADVMAHIVGSSVIPDEIQPELDDKAIKTVNMQPESLRTIANDAIDNVKSVESFLNFVVGA